jgi:hypothetical protein
MSRRREHRKNKFGLTAKENLIVRLDARAPKIADPGNKEFAKSLLKQWARRGELTENQWHWAHRLAKAPLINERPKKSEHFVYAIRCGEFVKIGFAGDPEKRRKSLQVGNPEEVEIVHLESLSSRAAAQKREAELHQRFAEYAVRGEWFQRCVLDELVPA